MNKIVLGNFEFEILIAVSEQEQIKGLKEYSWPPPIMVFPFDKSAIHKFWMHKTSSPLDLVFCNKNKIIEIVSGIPFSLDRIGPDLPSDLVVELPGGLAKKIELKVGQAIDLKYSLTDLTRRLEEKLLKFGPLHT